MGTLRSTMSSLAKQQIGARVHARAHLALGEAASKRFYWSLYKETMVSGGVLKVETEAGKGRMSIFLIVTWDSLALQRDRRISVRSVTLRDSPPVTPAPQQKPQGNPVTPAPRQTEKERNTGQAGDSTYSSAERDEPPTAEPPLQTQTIYDAHGVVRSQREVLEPVGAVLPRRMSEMPGIGEQSIVEGGDSGTSATRRPLDYLMATLPHGHLIKMVQWASEALQDKGNRGVSTGELLKFLGILILGTRYHFGKQRDL